VSARTEMSRFRPVVEENVNNLSFGNDFNKNSCKFLSNAQVAVMLEERKKSEGFSGSKTNKRHFEDMTNYLKRTQKIDQSYYGDSRAAERLQSVFVGTESSLHGLEDFEKAVLLNLCPSTVEEAKNLLISLVRFDNAALEEMLKELRLVLQTLSE